jgi:GAF domain-containing protein
MDRSNEATTPIPLRSAGRYRYHPKMPEGQGGQRPDTSHRPDTRDTAKLQDALYRITDMASAASDMSEFYVAIHGIVGELMFANNLFIALFDPDNKTMNYPYYRDEVDLDVPDPRAWEPMGTGQARGATAYVLRTGVTQRITDERHLQLQAMGEIELVGEPGQDWLGVPLVIGGRTIGAVVVQTYEPGQYFSDQDIELLEYVAQHIASALSRARAIDETKRLLAETNERAAELTLINSVQAAIGARLEPQQMYDFVGDKLQKFFDAQVVSIGILDDATGMIRFPYVIERGVRLPDEPIAVIGFRKQVLTTRKPLVINERVAERAAEVGQPAAIQGEAAKSSVFAPIIVGGRATGVISLQNLDHEHAFSPAHVKLFGTVSASLSVALDNVRLADEMRKRVAELGTVNSVGQAISAQLDPDALIALVGEKVRDTFAADIVYVALHDDGSDVITFPYYDENGPGESPGSIPFGDGWTSRVLIAREPLLVNSAEEGEQVETRAIGTPTRSYLGVPILVGDEAIGVIAVENTREEGRFSDSDQRLLATIASGVGAAIQNSRLFGETRRLYTEANEYLQQVNKVTDAAVSLEGGKFDSGSLQAVALREDALGQLARTFQTMATEVVAREARLNEQVRELRIEIDEARQSAKVAEITGSDYFQDLRSRADDLRRAVRQPDAVATHDDKGS